MPGRRSCSPRCRAAAYYSALLVNVGCHTDAYEFALGGHKQVEAMIAQHAGLARSLGDELGLPPGALDALVASDERWDGKGWPGEREGERIPLAARVIQLAEFAEVAHRNHGTGGAVEVAGRGSATQFDPNLVAILRADAEKMSPVSPPERSTSCASPCAACRTSRSQPASSWHQDRRQPHRAHLHQDRSVEPGRSGTLRHAQRTSARHRPPYRRSDWLTPLNTTRSTQDP